MPQPPFDSVFQKTIHEPATVAYKAGHRHNSGEQMIPVAAVIRSYVLACLGHWSGAARPRSNETKLDVGLMCRGWRCRTDY